MNTLTPKSKSGLNSQMPLNIDTWPLESCSVICHRTELWDYTGMWCQRKKKIDFEIVHKTNLVDRYVYAACQMPDGVRE